MHCFLEVFDDILGSIREPVVVLDAALNVVKANDAFYRIFNLEPDETEGTVFYDLHNRQWDIPRLRELLEDILAKKPLVNDFEVENTFEDLGSKILQFNARWISGEEDESRLIYFINFRCN